MSTANDLWLQAAREICAILADGLDVSGTVESADIFTSVGVTCLEIVVEATDTEGDDQIGAYTVLCDLLATRLGGVADQVLGILLIETTPSPVALAAGLRHMRRLSGTVVPVLPLSGDQARALAANDASFGPLAEDALALIRGKAQAGVVAEADAAALLASIAGIVERHCAKVGES